MDCLGPQLALWMVSTSLTSQWKVAIVNAIVEGNTLHDNVFEDQAVNLDTEDAFEISEDELDLSTYDEQQCYCQNRDLGNQCVSQDRQFAK